MAGHRVHAEGSRGAIFEATTVCLQSFTDCLAVKELMRNEWAENRLADFNLWISGTGALARSRASLDSRLAPRPEAASVIANVLQLLSGTVDECMRVAPLGDVSSTPGSLDGEEGRGRYLEQAGEEPPPTRSFSPWSDDSSSDTPLNSQPEQIHSASELQDNMEAVEAMLNQLARIAVAVRRSGRRSRLQKADQRFIPEEHEDLESHLVTILLARPGCSKEQLDPRQLSDVQRRLIRCNLKRRNRFLYAQEHSIRLAPAISGEHATEKARLQQPTSDVLARGALKPLTVDATPWEAAGISANPTLRTGTSASAVSDSLTLPQDMAPAPAASTIMSSTVIDLKYPRPPKIEKGALIFPCPCCCETLPVAFSDINKWKKHVADDLSPYTCVLPECANPEVLFTTKDLWRHHLLKEHSSFEYWLCFACGDRVRFQTEEDFIAHTKTEHAGSVPADQISLLASVGKRSAPMEIKSCPLCKWPEWEEGEGEVDRDQLLEHVAKDLHSFSLRALPWADDSGQETHERIRYSSDKVFDWLVQHELLEGPDRERPPLERKAYMSKYFPPNPYFRDSSVASSSDNSKSTASREKDLRKWKEEEGPVHFERNESEVRSDISGTRVDGVKLDHLISESSLLRVATLADELVSLCAFHEEALLIDPSDPKRLRRYVHAMKVTLQEALERDESSKSRLYSSQQMGSALRECELRLQHSINILERSTKANRITRAPWPLEWPFIPKEIDDTILILQRTQALMGSVPMPDIDLAELQSKQEVEDESSDQIVLSQTPDEFFDNHSESLENSLKLLQTALNVREKYLGPENERTLLIVYHIGSVLFSLGRYEEAERAFERLIEIDSPLTIISKAHIELARYNTTGLGKHLEWGIAAAERATHRAMGPGEIQERQRIFVRLLTARFDCDDNLGDLEEAITTLQNIIAENGIVPSQRSVGPLKELGRLVLKHYQRAGDISYTERAFTFMINSFVTPNEPLIHSGVLEQLSHLYLLLCKETRDYGHLEAAIYGIQKFVAFMNSDHPSSVSLLDNLSQLFLMRFNATGNLEDLEKSIEYMQIVIGATPDGHPGITEMLSDVGLLSDYFRMLRFRMDTAPNNPSQNSSQAPAEDHVAASELSPNYFKTFFVVEKELGRGSKGVVLLVRHELDGVELGHYAAKRVPIGDDTMYRDMIRVNYELVAKLTHPNLVAYRHLWIEDVTLTRFGPSVLCVFILMQYCNTGSLHQYIVGGAAMTREDLKAQIRRRSKGHKDLVKISRQSRRNLSLEEVYSIFKDIVSGLAYLHSSNYIHRELNPSNCLLHRDGSKITGFISDYGEIKTPVNSRQSIYDTSTLVYSAPETLRKDESGQYGDFTTKSDVFSLGMILYFMCFSNLPYENANIENEELEDVELLCEEISHWQGFQYGDIHRQHPDLPPKLILLMEKLLSLNPTERPNTQEILGVLLS